MHSRNLQFAVFALVITYSVLPAPGENIDPDNDGSQYAYGENIGWLNFEPTVAAPNVGATVTSSSVTGYVWAENIGWINLAPAAYGGVANDGTGNLSGYAWGENVGWVSFSPNHGGVKIDPDGTFSGWAWAENVGWIHFQSLGPVPYKVKTAWTYCNCMGDLTNDGWLGSDDVSFLVSQLLPYASSYYWIEAKPGSCGDLTADGWLSAGDVSALVSELLPYQTAYYWKKCE